MMGRHKFLLAIILLAGGGAFYYSYRQNSNVVTSNDSLQTTTAQKGAIEILVTGSGQIQAKSQVDLKGVAAGDGIDVIEVAVKNDQAVKKGDLIAVLDSEAAMKKIRNAKLDLWNVQISLSETKKANKNQTVEEKWARQKQEIALAQKTNALADAYDDLDKYRITAPFDGIVTDLNVDAGDSISQSDVIASIITKEMYAAISLNEVDAAKVKVGNEVNLTLDALNGTTLKGKISKLNTIGKINQNVVSYNAEIELENSNELIKPGMSVNAEIIVQSKQNVLTLPNLAIKNDTDGSAYVQILTKNDANSPTDELPAAKIIKQKIQVGITDDAVTEIVSGLNEGDLVVLKNGSTSNTKSNFTNNTGNRSLLESVRMTGGGR